VLPRLQFFVLVLLMNTAASHAQRLEGSRLLQNDRAAILESGSPPGLGQLVREERLQTYPVHFSPFKRPVFLSYSSSCFRAATANLL
jgi:hypothetical protein